MLAHLSMVCKLLWERMYSLSRLMHVDCTAYSWHLYDHSNPHNPTITAPYGREPILHLLLRIIHTPYAALSLSLQAYPFVVRKVLRNDDTGGAALLRAIVYDTDGRIRPTRLSALLQAALGYVAQEGGGFVDFDAVPEDGASVQVCSAWGLESLDGRVYGLFNSSN